MARQSLESEVIIDLVDIVASGEVPSGEEPQPVPADSPDTDPSAVLPEQEDPSCLRAEQASPALGAALAESYETASEYGMENYPGWIAYRSEESETMLVDSITEELPEEKADSNGMSSDSPGEINAREQAPDGAERSTEEIGSVAQGNEPADGGPGSETADTLPLSDSRPVFDKTPREGDGVSCADVSLLDKNMEAAGRTSTDDASVGGDVESRLVCLERRMALVEENVAALASRIAVMEEGRAAMPAETRIPAVQDAETGVSEVAGEAEEENPQVGDGHILETLASLCARVDALEALPPCPDESTLVRKVLDTVRGEIDRYTAEQSASIVKILSEMQRRIRELETRPAPQLLLPELPDVEGMVETVLERLRGELDATVASVAARILREEIAALRRSEDSRKPAAE